MNPILEDVELERLQLRRGQKSLMEDILTSHNSYPQEDLLIPEQCFMFDSIHIKQLGNIIIFLFFFQSVLISSPTSHQFSKFKAVQTKEKNKAD